MNYIVQNTYCLYIIYTSGEFVYHHFEGMVEPETHLGVLTSYNQRLKE